MISRPTEGIKVSDICPNIEWSRLTAEQGKTSGSLRKFAYDSMYRPGIDLAVVIAVVSAATDLVSLFFPWLVGINSIYVPGRGLTYSTAILLSGTDLFGDSPYLAILFLPVLLTIGLVLVSIRSEGLIPPRISYKTKSMTLLLLAVLSSMLPAYAFVNRIMMGVFSSPRSGVFVGRWELGGAATMPLYAGFGFILALGLKIMKD